MRHISKQLMWLLTIVLLLLSLTTDRAECQRKAGKMYVAIAAPPGEPSFSRAFNKTLANITQGYLPIRSGRQIYNITLDTLVVELPVNGSFSSSLLEKLCAKFEGKHVISLLLIGDSPAAFTVSLAATYAGVPVLWARGQGGFLTGFNAMESSALEMHLAPTSREVVQALRGVLLQAHWHTFTLLADRTSMSALQRPELWSPLSAAPLHPTLVQLPTPLRAQQIFRKLADISRSTRGVVILMMNRPTALRILEDAKRLNMLDGHFVWIWIDTYSKPFKNVYEEIYMNAAYTQHDDTDVQNDQQEQQSSSSPQQTLEGFEHSRTKRERRDYLLRSELNDMHVNYLLKNDQFLLFNHRNNGVESSKKPSVKNRKRLEDGGRAGSGGSRSGGTSRPKRAAELPVGLLSIRPVPIKVDRHLVKGTVRLLISTLRVVLEREPDWLVESFAYDKMITSCWKTQGNKEHIFSTTFGRELKTACIDALAGKKLIQDIGVDKLDKSLVANFEILNLVPDHTSKDNDITNPINTNANNNNSINYNNNNINNINNLNSNNNATGSSNNSSSTNTSLDYEGDNLRWKRVGIVSGRSVRLDTIVWPGGDLSVAALSTRARTVFRVVTALAPPFVMESELDEDGQCLRGLPCHRVLTADKDNLTLVFNEMETKHRLEEEQQEEDDANRGSSTDYVGDDDHVHDRSSPFQKFKYRTHCCYGLSMDLLENIAAELEFDFRLYIVADGLFGSKMVHKRTKTKREVGKKFLSYRFGKDDATSDNEGNVGAGYATHHDAGEDEIDVRWNGVVGDLVSGAAHMSFAPLSVSSARSDVIDYSAPYFFSGVSFIAAPQQKSEIPLMAFLLPFSPELWIAIFTSLNITAIAVAIYEWLSPFGLNPWGRQRSKNFSMSSALWVMWGLLCGHLVAFKAPKSWPNKFLINVWGGFSVIFVASYTANIAALIAGLFFHNTVSNYHDRSLLSQKVGTPKASASEFYVQKANRLLWEHMHKYTLENVEDGIERLRNGSLDILIADTPILDYYRATDHGCKLQKIGDTINEDTYAIGMTKGFPLKDSISSVIAKYSSNGYMDILQEKWYGGLPCFKLEAEIAQPRPLGVAAVTGVFILLGLGMVMGLLILLVEHLFFRYTLPILREKPKGSVWRSRNIMFFSQKLYRFINCVELVSPHHAARELVHTIRQGQITSLFQKSIKRKEHEQRRRRKSKAQFFEMIQEIRRQQQEEREQPLESVAEVAEGEQSPEKAPENHEKKGMLSPNIIQRTFKRTSPKLENTATHKSSTVNNKSPTYFNKPLIFSPRSKDRAASSSNLNVRRFSTDSVFNSNHTINRNAVGRRLSKDASHFLNTSPPDINSRRSSYLDIVPGSGGSGTSSTKFKSPVLSIENVSNISHERKLSDAESIGRKLATLPKYRDSIDKDRLQIDRADNIGKSEEAICNKANNRERLLSDNTIQAHSYTNILNPNNNPNPDTCTLSPQSDPKSSDDEATRRNKQLQMELQNRIAENQMMKKDAVNKKNPHIRIQVEDTSSSSTSTSNSRRRAPPTRKGKRHQSLGGHEPEPVRRTKIIPDQSKSLDATDVKDHDKCQEHNLNLPPAPPPPNCSPRNSNGRSPLERLSKDELVLLWRSSESELRSHLLKAIRDKDEVAEKPP